MGTRTGIPAVDRLLDVVEGNDVASLIRMAEFATMPCTGFVGPGSIACLEGGAAGTPVPLFGIGSCAPNYVSTRDELAQRLASADLRTWGTVREVYDVPESWGWGQAFAVLLGHEQQGLSYFEHVISTFTIYIDSRNRLRQIVFCPNARPAEARRTWPP